VILTPVAVQSLRARVDALTPGEIMLLISSHEQLRAIALVRQAKVRGLEAENEELHLERRRRQAKENER
jgi:hypothetical protein